MATEDAIVTVSMMRTFTEVVDQKIAAASVDGAARFVAEQVALTAAAGEAVMVKLSEQKAGHDAEVASRFAVASTSFVSSASRASLTNASIYLQSSFFPSLPPLQPAPP